MARLSCELYSQLFANKPHIYWKDPNTDIYQMNTYSLFLKRNCLLEHGFGGFLQTFFLPGFLLKYLYYFLPLFQSKDAMAEHISGHRIYEERINFPEFHHSLASRLFDGLGLFYCSFFEPRNPSHVFFVELVPSITNIYLFSGLSTKIDLLEFPMY